MRSKKFLSVIGLLLTLALAGAACAPAEETDDAVPPKGEDKPAATSTTGAATLRAGLTGLLTEHIYLAALATGAALRGDNAAFEAWAGALNGPTNSNSADIVAAVGSAYGSEVGNAFNGLWRSEKHIPAVVAYTQATAKGDKAGQEKAVADLLDYAKTFGETMNQVNSNLPAEAVEEAIKEHIITLKAVIDAQKAGDQPKVYSSLRTAYHHMDETAKVLAVATAKKFPDRFDGDAASKTADITAGLTSLLREHVFLASSATGGALAGRVPQFEAAAALNGETNSNSADIVAAVTSVYGSEVGNAFNGLWRSEKHIPAVVAYTQATAKGDKAGQEKAVADLLDYAKTFGTTMNSVNSNLPAAAVEDAIKMHITTLKAVIDAQKAGDAAKVTTATREAVGHMSGTADVLAEATVKKFPDKF
jgi:dihydroneopterin aldolase